MALDGILLSKVIFDLNNYLPMRINKIYGINKTEILFYVKTKKESKVLLISTESISNRIHFTEKDYINEKYPNNFVMLLRKHLLNGQIIEIKQKDYDRFVMLKIKSHNNIGDEVIFNIYLELLGRFANMIFCDENDIIYDATKRISPIENPNAAIIPGAKYEISLPQFKKNPFKNNDFDINDSLVKQFSGFSPTLEKEVRYRIANNQSFLTIMDEIKKSDKLVITEGLKKPDFHAIPLLHLKQTYKAYPIHQGFEKLYYDIALKKRIAESTRDLAKFVKAQLKKQKRKLLKLNEELDKNQNADIFLKYGDLIITYQNQIKKGMKYTNLVDYETAKPITIDLDEKLDAIGNAQKYYKIYRKKTNSLKHLQQQILDTENEIKYFEILTDQLDFADINSAQEMRQELIDNKYIFDKSKFKDKRKPKAPKFLNIEYDVDTTIRVGKNNIQNDYVTFKASSKKDYWFHVQDYHGAHVVVATNNLTTEVTDLAASLAAYYSKAKASSNIPVNFTQIKNVKKIPRAPLGMVKIDDYETVFINIDKELIEEYTK
ncbi:MAG: fibronectin/fibrinogen-binding protein [Erysipelothrix sp.]|nr:fibronectin/fibrinogen-binding protein [Erysipelothrix sp.]